MATPRTTLLGNFKNGESPTESHFKSLIDSIMSRFDDGLDKDIDSPLKIMAGSPDHAPVISLCPKGVLDPLWMISLKAFQKDGLNIGQGDNPENPVVFLEKATSNVGLGTNAPGGALEIYRNVNGEVGALLQNPNDGNAAYVIHRLKTRGGDGVIFKNSNLRADDGGINTMTVRNDAGDLRLQSQGAVGAIMLKGDTGFVGINTSTPMQPLEVNGAMNLSGNSLFFPKTTGVVGGLGATGLFWNGANAPAIDLLNYGIYKTDGPWTGALQQLRLQFASGIQLAPGTGPNAGVSSKSYVEVVNGRGLMVNSGNLGVGTVLPSGKAHVVTAPHDGNTGTWGAGQLVVGMEAATGVNSGAIALSYSNLINGGTSFISSLSPNVSYRDLGLRAFNTIFYAGATELMRLTVDGKLGIGTNAPGAQLQVKRDANEATQMFLSNSNASAGAYVAMAFQTNNNAGWIIRNSSTRNDDGGVNTMTVRNDVGDLRLLAEGQLGMVIKANSGNIGIGTSNPNGRLDVAGGPLLLNSGITNVTTRPVVTNGRGLGEIGAYSSAGLPADDGFMRLSAGGGTSANVKSYIDLSGYSTIPDMDRNMVFGTAGQERMRLTVDGNLGIGMGSNAPAGLLHVRRDVNDTTRMWLTNLSNQALAQVAFGLQTDNSVGYLFKNSSTRVIDGGANTMTLRNDLGDLRLLSEGQPGITIKAATGNIAFGTAAGDHFLHARRDQDGVVNSILRNASAGVNAVTQFAFQNDLNWGVLYKNSSTRTGDGGPNAMTMRNEVGDLRLQAQGANGLTVKALTGFVGIGTPDPQVLLQVRRDSVDPVSTLITNTNPGTSVFAQIGIQTDNGGGYWFKNSSTRLIDGGPNTMTLRNDSGDLRLQATNGVNGLHVKALSGFVGVATINPASLFSVGGNLTIGAGKASNTAAPVNGLLVEGEAIVNGSLYAQQGLRTGTWGAGAIGSLELIAGNGSPIGNRLIFGTDNSGWKFTIAKRHTASQTITDLMVFHDNGSVGIGTPNPMQKLQLNGGNLALALSDNPALQSIAGGHNLGALMFYGHGRPVGNDSAKIFCGSTNWDDSGYLEFCTSNDGAASVPRMRITEIGKVGIGTTNPAGRMHVATTSSDGSVSAWDTGQFVVGQEGTTGGGVALSYNSAFNIGTISSLSPAVGWRELHVRAHRTVFHSNGGTEVMRVDDNNLVGIGNNRPLAPLSIGFTNGKEEVPDGSMHITNDCILFGGNNGSGREANSCQISAAKHGSDTMCIVGMSDAASQNRKIDMWAEGGLNLYGRMCIGNARTTPSYPLQINTAVSAPIGPYWYLNRWTANGPGNMTAGVSIWAADRIVASEFNAISDARVKENMHVSHHGEDLERLRQIEVTDYQYRDFLSKGNAKQKGFIAQQVEAIYPEAVATHTEFIPDIYDNPLKFEIKEKPLTKKDVEAMSEIASTVNGEAIDYESMQKNVLYITMGKNHELAKGQLVRVLSKDGMAEKPAIVINRRTFAIDGWEHGTEDLFVYGRQVDDFRVVDYNRIFSLNVSATQELHRQVDTLKAENAELQKQVAAIQKALGTLGISFEA